MPKQAVNSLIRERRVAVTKRRQVAEMSPEEMRRELLTSEVTGLPIVVLLMKQEQQLRLPCPT
jgi:hypothetical protein